MSWHPELSLPPVYVSRIANTNLRDVGEARGRTGWQTVPHRDHAHRDPALGNLQRNIMVQPLVMRAINHTHPTSSDLRKDAVMRDRLANHWAGAPLPWRTRKPTAAQVKL